jgi:type I restriction enzyme M protein
VGKVLVSDQRCILTDDVIVVNALDSSVDLQFLAFQLRREVAAGAFLYEAKLFAERVREVDVDLSVKPDGSLDLEQQRSIASAVKRFDDHTRS